MLGNKANILTTRSSKLEDVDDQWKPQTVVVSFCSTSATLRLLHFSYSSTTATATATVNNHKGYGHHQSSSPTASPLHYTITIFFCNQCFSTFAGLEGGIQMLSPSEPRTLIMILMMKILKMMIAWNKGLRFSKII